MLFLLKTNPQRKDVVNLVYAVSGLGHRSTSSVCMYHNKSFPRAGSKTHSGRLNIYGPPTARTFPKDLKAVEGLESILQCPMGGYPLGYLCFLQVQLRLITKTSRGEKALGKTV